MDIALEKHLVWLAKLCDFAEVMGSILLNG